LIKGGPKRKGDKEDNDMDFAKSKKGLGELYQDDLQKKLLALNSDAFLENEMNGPDAGLKREIEDLSKELYMKLDQLSNFHYTPRAPRIESTIQTKNVPALMLEDAIPIAITQSSSKSAREMFDVKSKREMRDKTELSKEETQLEHRQNKRKIKAMKKSKALDIKEKRRAQGLALAERFSVRETERKMEKLNKKKGKKGSKGEDGGEATSRRTNTSSKVFAALNTIVKKDYELKDAKRANKAAGKGFISNADLSKRASSDSTKRHKL
jgi:hypothetical protein